MSAMTPERWRVVKDVLHQAMDLAPGKRSAFLDKVCSSDHSLRREVETLLGSSNEAGTVFLQSSGLRLTLPPGTRLEHYEVRSMLGAGGMGEVYRAHDQRLGRDVAIKVLPRAFSNDPDRLRRFEQEARAAAALNHPNILAIYDVGTTEEAIPYVVSELLEGETLRQCLIRGPLPMRKTVDLALQMAGGLAAAHDKGIIHRDLKPENLFLTKEGRLKILDFGLAKLLQESPSPSRSTLSTESSAGIVMGTVGYMPPEQLRGLAVDQRSDIFAAGAIVYEMLSGKRAFRGETAADTNEAILNRDPPALSETNPFIPLAFERIVRRCLEKNPDERFHSIRDVAFALEAISDLSSTPASGSAAREANAREYPAGLSHLRGVVFFAAAIVVLAGLFTWLSWPPPPPKVVSTTQVTHDGVGKTNVLTDGARLYLSELQGVDGFLVESSVSDGNGSKITTPFIHAYASDISPDHTHLLVGDYAPGGREGEFWDLPLPSGSPRRLGELIGHGGAWSLDGQRLAFAQGSDIYTARADGTGARKLTAISGRPDLLRFSPDSGRIRFTVESRDRSSHSLWEIRTDGGDLHPLLPGWHNPSSECCGVWSADGRYYFFVSTASATSNLWALREPARDCFANEPHRLFS